MASLASVPPPKPVSLPSNPNVEFVEIKSHWVCVLIMIFMIHIPCALRQYQGNLTFATNCIYADCERCCWEALHCVSNECSLRRCHPWDMGYLSAVFWLSRTLQRTEKTKVPNTYFTPKEPIWFPGWKLPQGLFLMIFFVVMIVFTLLVVISSSSFVFLFWYLDMQHLHRRERRI